MSASSYDLPAIEQGSSYKLYISYTDSNGAPINLTNYCARLTILTDDSVNIVFTTDNTNLSLYSFVINGSTGELILQIPASVTNNYTFTSGKYDLEIESPTEIYTGGGKQVTRILYGNIMFERRYSESNTLLEC